MDIKATVKTAIDFGFSPVPMFYDKQEDKWKLRKFINKDTDQYGYPLNHKAWKAADMPMFALVLQNTLLIDVDANKAGASSVEELQDRICEELGIDEFDLDSALFQYNETGDSLHYLFALPASIDFSDIAQSNDGKFIKNVDFKTGRQLVNIKPGKTINWTNVNDLPVINEDALLRILPLNETIDYSNVETVITNESTAYGRAAIRGINERATVFVEEGGRNAALAAAVVATYELVAGGQISEKDAENSINDIVVELGIEEESDTKTTIKFNKEKGLKQPKAPKDEQKKAVAVIEQSAKKIETIDDITDEIKRLANIHLDQIALDIAAKSLQVKYKEILPNVPQPSLSAIKKQIKGARESGETGSYVDDYVFLTATGEYCERETKAVMGPRAFDVKHTRETPSDSEGNEQTASKYSNNIIKTVENTMYFPMAGDLFMHQGLEYLNGYTPYVHDKPLVKTNIVDRIKAHVAHLLPNKDEQSLVINYLAHNVQHPGRKIPWAIVLQGVQGDGKSLLAEMMQLVLGYNNVRIMNVQTLESSFTGWATGQCMTFIEELKLDNYKKYEILNNLKPYISNPMVEETKKGKDPRTVVNTTNYFALTNFKDAIPIDENDRRYCILFSQWQRKDALELFMKNNKDYYPNLYIDMRNNAAELYFWLKTHKIDSSFMSLTRAPETQSKLLMMELSKSDSMIALEEALEEFEEQITCEDGEIDITRLQQLVKIEQDMGDRFLDFPQKSGLKNQLLNLGFEMVGRKRTQFSEMDNKHTTYRK